MTRKRSGGALEEDWLPMSKSLREVLQQRKSHQDTKINIFHFSSYQLRTMMSKLCKEAKVRNFGFHAIRHHVASILNDDASVSMKQVQKLLRHKKQSTTEIYLHVEDEHLTEAMNVLDSK